MYFPLIYAVYALSHFVFVCYVSSLNLPNFSQKSPIFSTDTETINQETKPVKSGKSANLQVENIAAPNLDTLHTFTVTDGTDTYTVTACALSYAYTSVKNGDSARQNLGKALYLYNQAANAYFEN